MTDECIVTAPDGFGQALDLTEHTAQCQQFFSVWLFSLLVHSERLAKPRCAMDVAPLGRNWKSSFFTNSENFWGMSGLEADYETRRLA